MPTYAFTFKKQSYPRFISYLDILHQDLENDHPDVQFHFHYEEDPKGIIHTHGIAHSPYNIYPRVIHPGKGWTVDWKVEKNPAAWRRYLAKDKSKETEVINKHNDIENQYKVQGERDSVSPADIDIHNDDVNPRKWKLLRIV